MCAASANACRDSSLAPGAAPSTPLAPRWPDVRSLVGDLMTREWIDVAGRARPERRPGTVARTLLVDGLVAGVREFRAHPLFRKIVDVDPELLLPYVLDRRGASQEALLELLAEDLREGHADGSVRAGHTERQARSLLLVVQSFALSLRTMTDEEDPDLDGEALLAELRTILERTLTP
ncbi:TetR/AcrR family transcriptional regulator [Streptomyces sp. NTH33]|uniref:TetR/AcrR family transcriptional regulator n=1 Tax=Streptomyces sp. NTH33 TaxID=1735453 RepID=UPI003F91EF3F